MQDLYPCIEDIHVVSFFSSNRKMRKSANCSLLESVLRISPSTGTSRVSIAIEWDECEFDHRALVSLERLGVQVLGATRQQEVTAVP